MDVAFNERFMRIALKHVFFGELNGNIRNSVENLNLSPRRTGTCNLSITNSGGLSLNHTTLFEAKHIASTRLIWETSIILLGSK